MQTNATTLNIVWTTFLAVVASELAVVCKRVQQLPTIRGPAVHCGKTTHKTLRPCVLRVRGSNNVLKVVQTNPTLSRYASVIMERKKCWQLLTRKFDRFQILRNDLNKHATGCANGRNM